MTRRQLRVFSVSVFFAFGLLCAAVMARSAFDKVDRLEERLVALEDRVSELKLGLSDPEGGSEP